MPRIRTCSSTKGKRQSRKRGVDLILGGFLHFQAEVEYFGAKVLPIVRETAEAERGSVGETVLVSA